VSIQKTTQKFQISDFVTFANKTRPPTNSQISDQIFV
jgi:hypothetical protein